MRYNITLSNGQQFPNATLNKIKKLFNPNNQHNAVIKNSGLLTYMEVRVYITYAIVVIEQIYEESNRKQLAQYDKTTNATTIYNQSPNQLALTMAILEQYINQ